MNTVNDFHHDPLDEKRKIDFTQLKPTGRNWAKILAKPENYVLIKPDIFQQFENAEQINHVLEQYLAKKSA